MDYCTCGSIKDNGECTNKHCPYNPEITNRHWIVDGVELRYKEPVTRKYAETHYNEAVVRRTKKKQADFEDSFDSHVKPWTG